jgi:hypothetical protein
LITQRLLRGYKFFYKKTKFSVFVASRAETELRGPVLIRILLNFKKYSLLCLAPMRQNASDYISSAAGKERHLRQYPYRAPPEERIRGSPVNTEQSGNTKSPRKLPGALTNWH